mmetsp:Transcript_22954/g.50574  ORF Transcript_22954/g.50574 Transcript_22954/m.50574 type:complete len:385 (-) Transcript_22954:45-1199(-)
MKRAREDEEEEEEGKNGVPPVPAAPSNVDVAVLEGIRKLRLQKRQMGAPKGHEVQLQINCVGICGSDMAYWAKGVAGGFVPLDFTPKGLCEGYCGQMGHECAGTVISVGKDVSHLKVGDRVALEPGVPCGGICTPCRRGRYNLCPKMRFIGSAVNRVPGAMCTLFNHDANFCYKLPEHVSLEEGAMLEPMCVSLQAVTRAKVGPGQKVLVSGAGPIGLMTALCARAAGAADVTITDVVDAKLAKAKELGVQRTFKATDPGLVAALEEATNGEGFDAVFECCGVPSALKICIEVAGRGSVVCIVANYSETTQVNLQLAARREIDLIGVYRYCNLYPKALALVASGMVDLKPLISKKFSLEQANDAFEYFATGEPIKVIIQPMPAS